MIEDVKKIVLEKAELEYNKIKEEYEEYSYTKGEIEELESELNELEKETLYPIKQEQFNFIQKFITQRKAYNEYRKRVETYNIKSQKADEIRKKLEAKKSEIQESKGEMLEEKKNELYWKIFYFKRAEVLKDLNVDVFDAIKILEENNMPIVLTEADKVVTDVESDFSSKSDLIGVHKTKFAPSNSQIKTAKDAGKTLKSEVKIDGRKYSYEFMSERDTVHMALNDEVSSHLYGSWEDCKYSILIPIVDIPNEKIGCVTVVDTFTKGSLNLPQSSWILCPVDEVEKMKKNNPNVNVIGYDGKSVSNYSAPFLSALGYKAEEVNAATWGCYKDAKKVYDLVEKEGIKDHVPHASTYFYEDERKLNDINIIVSICNIIKREDLFKNPNIVEQLKEVTELCVCAKDMIAGSRFSGEKYPDAICANHKHLDIFFSKMKENGYDISDNYKSIFRRLEKIGRIKKNNAEQLFEGLSDLSENEKSSIDSFNNSISTIEYTCDQDRYIEPLLDEIIIKGILDSIERSKEISKDDSFQLNVE